MKIKVLIADDQTLLRQGLRTILDLEDDIKVIAEAQDGLSAVELASREHPDVILMDVPSTSDDRAEDYRRASISATSYDLP